MKVFGFRKLMVDREYYSKNLGCIYTLYWNGKKVAGVLLRGMTSKFRIFG